jgi:hypothetical protein
MKEKEAEEEEEEDAKGNKSIKLLHKYREECVSRNNSRV